jgi:hypothetical protein
MLILILLLTFYLFESFFKRIVEIFTNIGQSNWRTIIVSVVSIAVIYLVKKLINEKFKDKMIM